MTDVLVWLAAVGFLISVFPIHIYNYFYINTATKYASHQREDIIKSLF